jgi:3-phenylpropionate/trans-cinnamate dioxygenase ferredoxin subunit
VERHFVCAAADLGPGQRRIVQIGRASIGVFNVGGTFYALRNICPHHGAELCLGKAGGTMLPSAPGEWDWQPGHAVVRCPRHRWEFDLRTGRSFTDPDRYRVKAYAVHVDGGDVLVEV